MMTKHDAIRQLKDLRNQARAQTHPRSRLAIQEYPDAGTAADDVAALTMAIKALQADRQDVPAWVQIVGTAIFALIGVICLIYTTV